MEFGGQYEAIAASSDDPVWQRLSEFELDDCDAILPFSKRLARENGWPIDYARRVADEYKRFLYLAVTQGVPVTPSDEVDQAWHLHLLYSRHYWGELCGKVLKTDLHHGPTRGGSNETNKYREWYERTLHLYETCFGEAPPCGHLAKLEATFRQRRLFQTSQYRHQYCHWTFQTCCGIYRRDVAVGCGMPVAC